MDSDSVFNPLGFVITTFHFPFEIPVTVTEPDVNLYCFVLSLNLLLKFHQFPHLIRWQNF